MKFNTPTSTILYSIEEAIKAYRRLCSQNIAQIVPDLTLDQALILVILDNNNQLSQMEIGDLVFKDYASITRIVQLMVKKNYLHKRKHDTDKRRSILEVSAKGKEALQLLKPTIQLNRQTALHNVSEEELLQLYQTLRKITNNCNT